jgi:XTP/dITP diphosphohydrolase
MTLVFATNNNNKIFEIKNIIFKNINVLNLKDIGCNEQIKENGGSLEENALIKARYVKNNYGFNCFADDTGLEVFSLNGEPGINSARYAGKKNNSKNNMDKLLKNLSNSNNRDAQFRTSIALIINNNEYSFEGIIKGKITNKKTGDSGFGYDPIFKPLGYNKTFSELSLNEKNKISHRGIALRKMLNFISKIK